MKKGFTLVEIILSIALIGIIAVSFLSIFSFSFVNLINSKDITKNLFLVQQQVEKEIVELSNEEEPLATNTNETIFKKDISGYKIIKEFEGQGKITVFQSKTNIKEELPELIAKNGSNISTIRLLDIYTKKNNIFSPQNPMGNKILMFNGANINKNEKLMVDLDKYKIKNWENFLVSVFKWHFSPMVEYSNDYKLDKYFILKEWNAAKPGLSYKESLELNFIPNIQEDPIKKTPTYNELTFDEIYQGLELSEKAELINRFGNRFVYFSITPYSLSGRIGREYFSNPVYVEAPRIIIENINFGENERQIVIKFKENISEDINADYFDLNESLGNYNVYRGSDKKSLIIEFENVFGANIDRENNALKVGSVKSEIYGAIHIWSMGEPNGEFIIPNS